MKHRACGQLEGWQRFQKRSLVENEMGVSGMEVYRGGSGEMGRWIVTEGMVVEVGE